MQGIAMDGPPLLLQTVKGRGGWSLFPTEGIVNSSSASSLLMLLVQRLVWFSVERLTAEAELENSQGLAEVYQLEARECLPGEQRAQHSQSCQQ